MKTELLNSRFIDASTSLNLWRVGPRYNLCVNFEIQAFAEGMTLDDAHQWYRAWCQRFIADRHFNRIERVA